MELRFDDTIAALATPPGTGGLAVLRVSGPLAREIVDRVFRGPEALTLVPTHTAHFGRIYDATGDLIDEVVATVFVSPQSYTGEDSVEVGCHGGNAVARAVLDALLEAGARMAEPGEFTRRAFLNGKMDLAQAEAVADLIHARSESARLASVRQLRGALSSLVTDLREDLVRIAGLLELGLDFVEEDVAFLSVEELTSELDALASRIDHALSAWQSGQRIRDGLKVVIAGRPNAGKSSLLNALLDMDRAIVTNAPGTTRDYLEETLLLNGRLFRMVDTAGLRLSEEEAEAQGIALALSHVQVADVVLVLLDASAEDPGANLDTLLPEGIDSANGEKVILLSKMDCLSSSILGWRKRAEGSDLGLLSVVSGEGLDDLRSRLVAIADRLIPDPRTGQVLLTNTRHVDCLRRASEAVADARRAVATGLGEEFAAQDLRRAVLALGEIIGVVTSDEVLNSVFSRFCIGK